MANRPARSGRGRIKRVRLLRLDVSQEGCPLADASRDHGVYVEVTSAALRGNDSLLMVWAAGGELRELFRMLRSSSVVKRVHVLHRDHRSAWLYIVKESSGILKTIYEAEGILASSIVISNGTKRFTVMVPSNNVEKLRRAASRNLESRGFRVRITDATYMLQEDSSLLKGVHIPFTMIKNEVNSMLTPMERRILAEIVSNGFFDWPRRSSLDEVASRYGLSKSTVSYHIRSAERKILGLLIGKYRLLEDWL